MSVEVLGFVFWDIFVKTDVGKALFILTVTEILIAVRMFTSPDSSTLMKRSLLMIVSVFLFVSGFLFSFDSE